MKQFHLLFIFYVALFFGSCEARKKDQNSDLKNQQKVYIKYAKGFNISYLNNIKILDILSPYPNSNNTFQYTFQDNKSINANMNLKLPAQRVVVSSTTHIPMLELLNEESALVGFQNTEYVSSEKTRKRIDNGEVRELGKKGELNTEVLLDINPDLVVGFAMSANTKVYNGVHKAKIPVILNGDWLEETPLGQAEWIKFFGFLFEKEELADSIFTIIEKNYLDAKSIAKDLKNKPTILSGAIMSKEIWNLPGGESFVAQFLKDANTHYLWQDSEGKGSLSLSFESVYEKAKEADIWIAPGYFTSRQQMLESNKKYKEFTSFKNGNIYTFAKKTGPTGGVIYYELAPTRPDLVLKDIIKICHPELLPNYKLTFFEKMQ